jgi:hypothetical protein
MASPEYLTLGKKDLNSIRYIGNAKVYAESRRLSGKASSTGGHEASHAIIAIKKGIPIKEVSVIPDLSAGSLGHVITSKPDAAVAMAAKAMGYSGTSHDERVASFIGQPDSGNAEAKSLLHSAEDEINEFGRELDRQHVLTGDQAVEIYNNIKNPEVVIYIDHPAQKRRTERKKMINGKLEISTGWFPGPK